MKDTEMTKKTPGEEAPANAFEHMLRTHRNGLVANKASDALNQVIEAARMRGKAASMTLTVTVKPQNDDQIILEVQCKAKLPDEKLAGALWYVDEDNRLHRSDPKQRELPLREVEKKDEVREVAAKKIQG